MKKLLWGLLACLLTTGAVASIISDSDMRFFKEVFSSRQMSSALHDAMAYIPQILKEQQQLQERGLEFSEEQQQRLAMLQQQAKGINVVLVGGGRLPAVFRII